MPQKKICTSPRCQQYECIDSLLGILPSIQCKSPRELMTNKDHTHALNAMMQLDTFIKVSEYLHQQQRLRQPLDLTNSRTCLQLILENCGVANPSWSEVKCFVEFLCIQLQSCEQSTFCSKELAGDVLTGLKDFAVQFMIRMSKDFATSSLEGEVARENQETIESSPLDELQQYQIHSRRQWEQSIHPYMFFNQDRNTITFIGFNVTPNGDLIHPIKRRILEAGIMSPDLFNGLKLNGVDFSEDFNKWSKETMVKKLTTVMGVSGDDPDQSYVLTIDNFVKILAIQMRFRCNIPVVIMGETGCGKTRLIRYMCELAKSGTDVKNMFIMKVHGGTTPDDISKFVEAAEMEATKSTVDTIAFFDEANTTDALGLIKEVMCDRRLNGRPVLEKLKFIAACNPYRKHSDGMIEKLKSAGLGYYVRESDTEQKLGQIPLRHLVYRVHDLPPSMRPLVYDFGQLNQDTEFQYTMKVVANHLKHHETLRNEGDATVEAIAHVFGWSQNYMKTRQDECSFVSLRDVDRAMTVLVYFYNNMPILAPLIDGQINKEFVVRQQCSPNHLTRSLLLSLSVCYHARLQDRLKYEEGVAKQFLPPLTLPGGAQQFQDEIRWCQQVLLDNMRLRENIARNAALRENVFMMAICIELKIPLFIVGKPGSSKSLAKSIIQESMKGRHSHNQLMKLFKEIDLISYQCSHLSTSESVIDVFNTAKKFQDKQDSSEYTAVVVLDEVGLAEDSPYLPLKALHPLLEDGTSEGGSSGQDIIVKKEKRVPFIGISNWALDPAKMNRGVMVTRGDLSEQELELSARGICSNKENDPVREKLEDFFRPLARSYLEICKKQARQFFGLRDFYSLIKMLYWMCDKSGMPPTWLQLEHAIKRNFSGLNDANLDPIKVFERNLPTVIAAPLDIPEELQGVLNPDCSKLGLIRSSLTSMERTWHGESRYLLFLTENYVALDILQHYLRDLNAAQLMAEGIPELLEPHILFGSCFPKDSQYIQVNRNINQIRVCMETGRAVILLNLKDLYESLYDVLNQYYISNFGNRYVDLGLQTHKVRCRVHNNFKLIIIAEADTVYNEFATPLINRLEKHFVLASSILEEWQIEVLNRLETWVTKFSSVRGGKFRRENAFIGIQKDTPATIILQSTSFLRNIKKQVEGCHRNWEILLDLSIVKNTTIEEFVEFQEDSEEWKLIVLKLSQFHLLQVASPDAIVRLCETELATECESIQDIYFNKQHHISLDDLLMFYIKQSEGVRSNQLLFQVTTHSQLLSSEQLEQLKGITEMKIEHFYLHEFETELDFCSKIGYVCKEVQDTLLVIQCDSSYSSNDLIACARYRTYDECTQSGMRKNIIVVFIIYVPCCNTGDNSSAASVGYQGDPWITAHIDVLRPSFDAVIPHNALGLAISDMFMGSNFIENVDYDIPSPLHRRIHRCIHASVLKSNAASHTKATRRIKVLLDLIPNNSSSPLGAFYGALVHRMVEVLKQRDEIRDPGKKWMLVEAKDPRKLHLGGTYGNILAHKVDEIITPILGHIISTVDVNDNLDLVHSKEELIMQLWLDIFCDQHVLPFSYDDVQLASNVTVKSVFEFKCRLPFSWIIKNTADELLGNAKRIAGNNLTNLNASCIESIRQSRIGRILDTCSETDSTVLSQYYLQDFVKMVHGSRASASIEQLELEYEVIVDSLHSVVQYQLDMSSDKSLPHHIAALHVTYDKNKLNIKFFCHLISYFPGILNSVMKKMQNQNHYELVLHLLAVDSLLDSYQELSKDQTNQNLVLWLQSIKMCQSVINSILSNSQHRWVVKMKQKWQLIQAMKMFYEHIVFKHKEIPFKLVQKMRDSLSQCGPDFHKLKTLQAVMKVLNKISKGEKSETGCDFFMEVVSSLTFGDGTAPEAELIKFLMDIVLSATDQDQGMFSTRDMTPCEGESLCNEVPVVHSVLLQLMIEHNSAEVKTHLNDFFAQPRQILNAKGSDLNLCLLCIQCFENALKRKFPDSTGTLELNVDEVTEVMNAGFTVLVENPSDKISIELLEGIAKMRYSLSRVAYFLQGTSSKPVSSTSKMGQFVHMAKLICSDANVNVIDTSGNHDTTGPFVYLMRVLVRQYGMSCLEEVAAMYPWVIPRELVGKQEENTLDYFTVYSDCNYGKIRESLDQAMYGKDMNPLTKLTAKMTVKDTAILLLGVYRKITLWCVSAVKAEQISYVQTKLDTYISRLKSLSSEMKRIGRMLISNTQGGNFVGIKVVSGQPKHTRNLSAFVIHSAIVFTANCGHMILAPFLNMLQNPALLKNSYLPTMQDDFLFEVEKARGNLYRCPNGHPYYVGECGLPMQESKCVVCKSPIGGRDHRLRGDNRQAKTNLDTTNTGYDLGDPNARSTPTPERNLSRLSVCIIRALMHAAFVWTCSNNESSLGDVADLVNLPVKLKPNELPEFFWKHLEKDLEAISMFLNRGQEESILVLHLVLKEILTNQVNLSQPSHLGDKAARKEWETTFDETYIQPVTRNLDQNIEASLNAILKDSEHQGQQDQLFYLIYERVHISKGNHIPHMWGYRPTITPEHIILKLQERDAKKEHPVLWEFLQAEPVLRATQYLPNIVCLQQHMCNEFTRHKDRSRAKSTTISQYVRRINNDGFKERFKEMIKSLNSALSLVALKLKNHGRLAVKDEYLVQAFVDTTPLEYLIPTTAGAGTCTAALVDFLTQSHNNFIERCRGLTSSQDENGVQIRDVHIVPIAHVDHSHLVIYEHHLQSMILSHCHYSLTAGDSHVVSYDFKALEKAILDHFVYGKPMIYSPMPQDLYQKDAYTKATFDAIRENVSPQDRLPVCVQQEILSELHTLERVGEMLDVVDIVLGFLSSGGGSSNADMPFEEYVETVLKMKPESHKIKQHCKLGHIISLWETLSVDLARKLFLRGEEPFDSAKEELLAELSEEEKQELGASLRHFDLDLLLRTLLQFIKINVLHSSTEELQWPIVDTLPIVLEDWKVAEIPGFEENFPHSIRLSQAIAVWKFIIQYPQIFL